jgi:hypothetical protein
MLKMKMDKDQLEMYFIINYIRVKEMSTKHLINPVKDVPEGFGGHISHTVFIFILIGEQFTEESTDFGQQYFVNIEA